MKIIRQFFLALAVLAITFTACDDGSDPVNNNNNNNNVTAGDGFLNENTLTIDNVQVWDNGSEYTKTVDELTYLGDSVFFSHNDGNGNYGTEILLSDAIAGSPSVTITNGKLSASLGTPKSTALVNWGEVQYGWNISVSPSNAKAFIFGDFLTAADKSSSLIVSQEDTFSIGRVIYVYSNTNATVSRMLSDPGTTVIAMDLKKGWNSVISEHDGNRMVIKTGKPSADYKWNTKDERPVGTISGTITLTDVPNPVPVMVSLLASSESWHGRDVNISVSGNGTYNWSMPIRTYGRDFSPGDADFSLYVYAADGENSVIFPIPAIYISDANAVNINLGTVSLKTITLSGTINVAYNGQPVPRVSIVINDGKFYSEVFSFTELSLPVNGASWSTTIPASVSGEVGFEVSGYDNWYGLFFSRYVTPASGTVTLNNANISGIVLNLGNFETVTLRGTINVTYKGQPVPSVRIIAMLPYGSGAYSIDRTELSSPAGGASWSMAMPAVLSEQVELYVDGYNNNNYLFSRSKAATITINNTNMSGIVLNLGNID